MESVAAMVLALLKADRPHRQLYRSYNGDWHITYGGGAVSEPVANEIISSGEVVSVYSNCPCDAYHVGKTLDVEATESSRKQNGNHGQRIYVQDQPAPVGAP